MLREHALIESAISSNRIEGVEVDKSRVGVDLIRQVLKRRKKSAQLVCLGRGPAAKWKKTSKWVIPI